MKPQKEEKEEEEKSSTVHQSGHEPYQDRKHWYFECGYPASKTGKACLCETPQAIVCCSGGQNRQQQEEQAPRAKE